jgi:hypothetical protein
VTPVSTKFDLIDALFQVVQNIISVLSNPLEYPQEKKSHQNHQYELCKRQRRRKDESQKEKDAEFLRVIIVYDPPEDEEDYSDG